MAGQAFVGITEQGLSACDWHRSSAANASPDRKNSGSLQSYQGTAQKRTHRDKGATQHARRNAAHRATDNRKRTCHSGKQPAARAVCRLAVQRPCKRDVRQYGAITERIYRECSEFVHGNAHTHSTESKKVVFQEQIFQEWHGTAKSFRLVTSFALCARYVRLMEANQRQDLEAILLDSLGHIPAIRAIFGAPVESIDV
jgi:hypothetical protein